MLEVGQLVRLASRKGIFRIEGFVEDCDVVILQDIAYPQHDQFDVNEKAVMSYDSTLYNTKNPSQYDLLLASLDSVEYVFFAFDNVLSVHMDSTAGEMEAFLSHILSGNRDLYSNTQKCSVIKAAQRLVKDCYVADKRLYIFSTSPVVTQALLDSQRSFLKQNYAGCKFKDSIIANDPLTSIEYFCELSQISSKQVLIVDRSEEMCQKARSAGFRALHLSELVACYDSLSEE